MEVQNIIDELEGIFKRVLDIENINLTPQTTAADVEEWDSLNHVQLIVAIEKHFKIRFTSIEIQNWKNVGEMCDTIRRRLVTP